MKKITSQKPWILALLLVTAIMLLIWFSFEIHYFEVDDMPTVQSFMGYEGGIPARFHLCYHTLLAWTLYGISSLLPGIAWVSVMQLMFLWLSNVVIVKSLMKCSTQSGRSLWHGASLSLGYMGAFSLYFYALPTFTTTGAMLGAAAVAELLSMDVKNAADKQIFLSMLLSVFLLICCYLLRQLGVLPPLAFWGLGLSWLVWKNEAYRSFAGLKPFIQGCAVCALSFLLLAGIRAVEIRVTQMDDYYKWQKARIELFDYTDFELIQRAGALEENGWSEAELLLLSEWYFMDENITADALLRQRDVQLSTHAGAPDLAQRLVLATKTIKRYLWDMPEWLLPLLVTILATGMCTCVLLWQRKEKPYQWVIAPCALVLGAVMLILLGWQGRINLRSWATVFLPMSTFVFAILAAVDFHPFPGRAKTARRIFTCALVMACLPCAVLHAQDVIKPYNTRSYSVNRNAANQLEDFARANPDKLVICSPLSIRDKRLFPDVSGGIPTNLISWGNWGARTPSWLYQLSVFGIDGEHFTPADFLRENVVIVGSLKEPSPALTRHIEGWTGSRVEVVRVGECERLGFYQYIRMTP